MSNLFVSKLDRNAWFTIGLSGLGYIVFLAFDWNWLVTGTGNFLRSVFFELGHPARLHDLVLTIDWWTIEMTRECTYVDLWLVSLPFVCSRRPRPAKLPALMTFTLFVLGLNFARIVFAVEMVLRGAAWWWVHEFVDWLIWYPVFFAVIVNWLRRGAVLPELPKGFAPVPAPRPDPAFVVRV